MLVLLGRERGSGDFDFGLCELAVLMALQYTTFYNCRSDSLITVAAIFLAQVQVCLPAERRCNTFILRNRSNCGVGDKQLAHALAHLKIAIQPPAFPSPATFHMCAPADRPVWWSTFTLKTNNRICKNMAPYRLLTTMHQAHTPHAMSSTAARVGRTREFILSARTRQHKCSPCVDELIDTRAIAGAVCCGAETHR